LVGGLAGAVSAKDKQLDLSSPDGRTKITVKLQDRIYYSIYEDDKQLFADNHLALELDNGTLGAAPQLLSSKHQHHSGEIRPYISLKYASIKDEYNDLLLTFKGGYSVEFRAYNDGVAYRFVTNKPGNVNVLNEDFSVNFQQDYLLHLQQAGSFKTAYEEPYTHINAGEWKNTDKRSTLPVLIDTKKNIKVLVSESDLRDYPAMFLQGNNNSGATGAFPKVPLAFAPDGDRSMKITQTAPYIAKTAGSRSFPWRYFVIAREDKDLLENTMTLRLAGKSEIADPSWIKPGKASWEWWNGATPYGPDVNFVAGCNVDTYKYFIDFAAKYGIEYIVMDEGWALSTRDPYTPNPNVDLKELIRYGEGKNVHIILWLTWLTVHENMDLFKTFAEWGVKGVKIDFMDRSDQWMVNYYEDVIKEAARHKIFVDFHGAFKPAGLEYRYPNLISYEGVRGMEQMGGCRPDNSLFLPFMRNAVGPMDYTPGAMLSMQPESYCSERPNAASIGTRAYQMALFVVFESGLQMLADNPTLYYRNPDCTDFIASVPTTWDETKVLAAEAGQVVVVAKRKGKKWFIGGITNNKEKARDITVTADFIAPGGSYTMTSFEDGINAGHQAMDYRKNTKALKAGDTFTIHLARNGGFAAVIE
jgi:alpha-glucosidase